MTILDEIFADTRRELSRRKRLHPLAEVRSAAEAAPSPPDFVAALREAGHKPALIAEIKFASPSRGVLVAAPDPLGLAEVYLHNGATALSVLTEQHYFLGHLDYLRRITARWPELPVLRKDFICDPYQVYEARAAGAAAVLLIAAGLPAGKLKALHDLASRLGLSPLVEVHNQTELELALDCGASLVGINNRNLHDFRVSLETTLGLRPLIPAGVCVVAESGIHTPEDVARLAEAGLDAVLVGEALVTAPEVGAKVRALAGQAEAGEIRITNYEQQNRSVKRENGYLT
jgi:indole-3-glycerol phosphate synthase